MLHGRKTWDVTQVPIRVVNDDDSLGGMKHDDVTKGGVDSHIFSSY